MANRGEHAQQWMKLSTSFYQDGQIMVVSAQAELVFVRMLALIKQTNSGGVIYESQLPLISRGLRRVNGYLDELMDAGLIDLISADLSPHQDGTNAALTGINSALSKQQGGTKPALWRVLSYAKWHGADTNGARSDDVSAGQETPSRGGARTRPRAPEREREEREEPSRPPTGTGREGSARAAPLAGGAAARHAQLMDIRAPWDPPDADTVDPEHVQPSDENAALIKAAIQKGYQSSNSKGQPAKLWKYPRELHSTDPEVRAALQTAKRNTDDPIRPALSDIVEQLAKLGISDEQMGLSGDSE